MNFVYNNFFPICFTLCRFDRNQVNSFFQWFTIILAAGIVSSCIAEYVLENYYGNYINKWKLEINYNHNYILYLVHSVSERIDFHHIYLSFYCFIGVVLGTHLLIKNKIENHWTRIILIVSVVFLFLFSILLISRMTLICYTILLISIGVFQYHKVNVRLVGIVILTVLVGVVIYVSKNTLHKRFSAITKDPRIELWRRSFDIISEKWVLGYGTEKGKSLLKLQQQNENNLVIYNNSHNQYMDYFLYGGIVSLLTFLIINVRLFYVFFSNKNYLATSIHLFFLVQLLTESLLNRYRGIVMYALLLTLFYSKNYGSQDPYPIDKMKTTPSS